LEIRELLEDEGNSETVHPRLKLRVGEVRWMARHEMARTPDDVLSRRSRSLLFDAKAAREAAPRVCEILAEELGKDEEWTKNQLRDFNEMSLGYLIEELIP
jgi:glycerol-3-phosphate dehydrogenase